GRPRRQSRPPGAGPRAAPRSRPEDPLLAVPPGRRDLAPWSAPGGRPAGAWRRPRHRGPARESRLADGSRPGSSGPERDRIRPRLRARLGSLMSLATWVASLPDYVCGANRGSSMAEVAVPVNARAADPATWTPRRRKSVRSPQYRAANLL